MDSREASAAHVLVVDDDPISVALVRAVLSPLGLSVSEAGDAASAVRIARAERPRLVLLDWNLPGGPEPVLQALLSPGSPGAPRVVAYTAADEAQVRLQAKGRGLAGFIAKPPQPDLLRAQVVRWLSDDGMPPSLADRKVLVVDDDADFRALVGEVLERDGAAVLHAGTVAEGAALAETQDPDLIVVDGHLPDGDGVRLIETLRAGGCAAQIVFVSAHWDEYAPAVRRLSSELQVGQVMQKPVSPAVLGILLARLLTQPHDAPAGEPAELALPGVSEEFARRLPERLSELRASVAAARTAGGDAGLDPARVLAHNLRGTAAAFGFAGVGDAMGVVEDCLRALAVRPPGPGEAEWTSLRAQLDIADALAESGPAAAGPRPWSSLMRPTVLCVVRDADQSSELQALCRRRGFVPVAVPNPERATDIARAASIRAAFLDANLPDAEGAFATARRLRELPGFESLPIAFVGGAGGTEQRVEAVHAGVSVFLAGPLTYERFDEVVGPWLESGEAERPVVLVLDDDRDFRALVERTLGEDGIRVIGHDAPATFFERLETERPDLLLLDVFMPGIGGLDICRVLRADPLWRDLPVVIVTVGSDPAVRMASFQAGCDDYVSKPLVLPEFLARVRGRLDRTRLLHDRLVRDALTGLLVRRAFYERLDATLNAARKTGAPVALGLLDLDHFKRVNDTHGHLSGDRVLSTLGRLLTRRFRAEDLRGRWGGEELVVAFHGADARAGHERLERALREFAAVDFEDEGGRAFRSTFSAGVSSSPADGVSPAQLVQAADRRLYAAKSIGRNRVVSLG